MIQRFAVVVVVAVAAGFGTRAAVAAPPGDRDAAADVMRAMVERYALDRDALGRRYPDSEAERERLTRFRDERLKELDAVDFEKLGRAGRIDYLLLRNKIAFEEKEQAHR